jgi:hypothetical protein
MNAIGVLSLGHSPAARRRARGCGSAYGADGRGDLAAAELDRVRSMAARWRELQDQLTRDAGTALPASKTRSSPR